MASALGFIPNALGFNTTPSSDNNTVSSNQPNPTSINDNTVLLQQILGVLQIIANRLAPPEIYRDCQFNNSVVSQTIVLQAGQVFNMIGWALQGGPVFGYFDVPTGANFSNIVPDIICTGNTQEQFLPDITQKTFVTFIPQSVTLGRIFLGRY